GTRISSADHAERAGSTSLRVEPSAPHIAPLHPQLQRFEGRGGGISPPARSKSGSFRKIRAVVRAPSLLARPRTGASGGERSLTPDPTRLAIAAHWRRSTFRHSPIPACHMAIRPLAFLALLAVTTSASPPVQRPAPHERHLLYVASPGTRNYTQYGGVGVLVFDIDSGYRFVRRIPTWPVVEGKDAENVKGIAASARTGRVYVTSLTHVIAIDAVTGKTIWDKP